VTEGVLVVRHGLARRVAGAGRRAFIVAAVAAVLGGLSGIALGSWLSWRDVDPKAPGRTAALSVAQSVLPGGPADGRVTYFGRSTFWNPYSKNSLHGGTGVRVGRASVTGTVPPQADLEQVAAAVHDRMRSQGWQDVRTTIQQYAEVTGTRDGYLAAVQATPGDTANPRSLTLQLMWAEPPGHVRDTILGGVGGALLGAILGLGTSIRMRRYSPRRQRLYSRLCIATLLLLTPACLANIPTSTGSLFANTHRNSAGPSVYWGGFVFYGAEPLAIASLVPILAILVCCVWPRPTTTKVTDRRQR
jgi:hypothetical protein